MRVDAVM